jgi:hypothetical protein
MISIILYGRNDSHGYNLHKRAAISLNAMAEVLSGDDEIIFVDYNTPDDLVTFPEAIADTLTDTCKKYLRIIRIRPATHNKLFREKTDLVAVEAASRNAAIRRSNPKNKWILCTNTDMIFAPRAPHKTLQDAFKNYGTGFYELPRYELPDLIWESLDRVDARGNIEKLKDWGTRFHINEIVHRPKEMLFDAPGDFQLFPRDVAHTIHGFDESHLLGWHLDSNIAKRLFIHFSETKTAEKELEGWHCNHTRSVSLVHKPGRKSNDFSEVFHEITRADLPLQKDTWGLAGEELEEIRLTDTSPLIETLKSLLPANHAVYDAPYISAESLPCPLPHMQVYLTDLLVTFPRAFNVAYLGESEELFKGFQKVWNALGFTGNIFRLTQGTVLEEQAARADLFIAAYTPVPDEAKHEARGDNQRMLAVLEQLFKLERARLKDSPQSPRKFIVINGGQRDVATLMARYTNAQENPFGTRIRHGYVTLPKDAR